MFLLNSKFQIPNSKKPTWNLESEIWNKIIVIMFSFNKIIKRI